MGPETRYARVAVAPIFPSNAAVAAFGLAIDRVRIVVVRPIAPPDTLADTTVDLPPDADVLDLNLRVPIVTSPESVLVSIVAMAGTIPLFQGTAPVEVSAGVVTQPTEIPVDTYVGPGAGVDSVAITPRTPFIYFGDSLRFQIQAFQGGTPVPQFYVSWSTSDTALAHINGVGTLHAPASRTNVRVTAKTPGGAADSVLATFQPVPNQLVLVAGGGQNGLVGQPLALPLTVEVRAADNFPVAGAAVRFRAPAGGSPADTTISADSLGHATVNAVLGSAAGAQTFQITLPGFPSVATLNVGATASSGAISPAQSIISVSNGTVASGNAVTLTLQGKDGGANNMTAGGATVVFSVTGGTSTGTIAPSPATDNGNGTYTASFTGVLAGTATTIHATIDGAPVATALPTVAVTPGAISTATSIVSVSASSVGSGGTATLTLQAKDAAGNNLTTGGATVAFTVSGGSSAGTIGSTTDHANGTYTAVFTATAAGTPATIGATIAAVPVTSALPTITVNAGAASAVTSVLTASTDSIASGAAVVLRLQTKDAAGNNLTSGGATVVFSASGGSSTGIISATADSGTGVYTATFTAVLAGTATTIGATINGSAVTTGAPTIAVKPGPISAATSVITASTDTLLSGALVMVTLRAKDAAGNLLTSGGATVVFSASGGSSTGIISATADSGTGVYTATFTGQAAGTATTIGATVNGGAVSTALPTLVVKPGAPSQLVFTVQPSASFIGTPLAPAVQVTTRDVFGNTTPAFTGSVTIAIGTNPAGGILSGTLSHAAVAGIAAFNDLQIDQPGVGYTLTASAGGLASGTSATFDLLAPSGTIAWTNAAGGNWSNPANWNGGVVPGPTDIALITLPGTYTVTFDVSDTIGGVQLGGSSGVQTLSLVSKTLGLAAGSQINANGVLTIQSSTINGSGSITNAGTLTVRASTITPGVVNQATLQVEGTTALNGPIATTPASTWRLQGNNSFSTSNLTVAGGFTNNGVITLTDSVSTYGATLHVTSGTLTNAAGASIQSLVGSNGTRTLDAQLDNQGTIDISRALSLIKSGAVAHSNSGTINVNAKFTIQQSGLSSSFANTGSMAIGSSDTVAVTAGSFVYSGGSISGGLLTISSVTVNASQNFTTATTALVLTNSTWGGSGTLTIAPSTALTIAASTLNSAVDNQGALTVHGATAFNGALTNAGGATLRLQGDGSFSTSNVTVANGFTNDGTIVLTDTTSTYGAVLNVTNGTLVNGAGATLTAAVGTNGPRTLNAQLDNQGTLTLDRAFTLNKPSAAHTNTGTIDVVNGKFTILQGGVSPSFTQSGTINIAGGDTVAVSSGTFNYASGAINGPGAITFTSTIVSLTQGLATGTVPFSIASSTVGGTGALTVSPATILQVKASTINAALINQGQLDLHGSTAINGAFTNASGATLRLQGDGTYSTANITFATAFTNNGAIVLTDTTSSYGAILNLATGQRLTNAPGGTITAAVGTAGPRTIGAELDNQGTLTLNRPLTLTEAGAQHLNSGTIDIAGGDFTLSQSGTTPTFTTSGTITIGAGRIFQVNSGTLNYNAGAISGSGTLAISNATVAATQDFSTATTALALTSATWGGAGTLTVAAGTFLNVKASSINSRLVNLGTLDTHGATAFNDSVTNASGATLRVQGDGTYSTGNLTVLNGFTNDGTIVLTDTTSSYGAILHVTNGTFVNAAGATVRADSGTRGPKTIDAQFDNEGAVAIAWPLTLTKASAAHVNRGAITANAKFTISLSGTTPSFRHVGTLTIGTGDTVSVNAGAFVYDSGSISGGALALSGTSVQAARDFSTASTALKVTSVTWSGAGTLTVAPSTELVLQATTINSGVVNQGNITINGLSTLNGAVTNTPGATLRVQGNGTYSTGTLTLATGFTNNGTIVLTDTTSTYGAVLNVTAGTLVNAASGTIRADTGTNGPRTINGVLDNQGTFVSAIPATQTTTINKASAAQQNSGTWTVASGTVTIQGAGASFTNLAGGTIQGAGTLKVSGIAFTNNGGITPGTGAAATGILKVVGNYAQGASGALNVQLGGTTVGTQYDRLVDSAGTVALNGALSVSLVNGFTPAPGDTFTVLTFPSRTGTIPTLSGLTLGGVNLDTLWSATSLRLVTASAQTVHAIDITTSQTWTAAASPHIVSGYLKVLNGATLTIEAGATVKFDAGAGLQIGDTALGQAGSLVMLGTPGSIHLTANSGTPAAGFWKGLEIQKAGAVQSWRNVDIEYGGGARANPLYEACVLLVDTTASVDLDSLHVRQCANAGVKHFGGSALIHRSIIDTTGNSGVLAGFTAVLRLDSTTIRGAQTGLMMLTQYHPAAGVVDNTLSGNGYPAEVTADALSAFGANLLTGNSRDTMVVQAGTLAAPYTMKRYSGLGWHVTGPIVIDSGAVLSIDTGTAVVFDTSAMVIVGSVHPSALHIEGSSANPVLLTASDPGKGWPGLRYALLSGSGNATQNLLRNAIIEHGGRHQLITCGDGCVYFDEGAIKFEDTSTPGVVLTVDSAIVRHSIGYAVEVRRGSGGGKVDVTHGQFYDNPLSPVFLTDPSDIGGLAVEFSDIYHYGGTYGANVVSTLYGAQFDSVDFRNNWWGDVSGPKARVGADFGNDSLRRADLGFYAVRTSGFATTPYFPGSIGAPVSLDALPDSQAVSGMAGGTLTDSLRSRLLDAFGRGVPAKPMSWSLPGGCGSLTGAAPTSDAGGRGGVQWTACTVAGDHIATASSAGATRNHHVLWQPGATTALDFALIQTDGIPRVDSNEVTFTSSGHRGVFVTRAKDVYGNVTQPTTVPSFCFTDVPFQSQLSQCHNPQWFAPQYGSIDSVKADTVYFTVTAATPAAMQIRAEYNGGALADSMLITINGIAAGMKLNADTADFSALCPTIGPYNAFCRRTFTVSLIDSAGAALPPTDVYHFTWANVVPGDTTVTIDATSGIMGEVADITAHGDGVASIIALQSLGVPLRPDRDTLAITAAQRAQLIKVTPDTLSAGIGDIVTFAADAIDIGGAPVPGATIKWRLDPPAGTGLTIIDFPTANSVRVRLDSVVPGFPRDLAVVTAYTERAPGDTLFASGILYNPTIQTLTGLPSQPWAVDVDPRTNLAYVADRGSANVAVVDLLGNRIIRFQDVGTQPEHVTVDARNARVYVTNTFSGTLSILDGAATGQLLATIPVGSSPSFIAVDTTNNRAYLASDCADPPSCTVRGAYLLAVDGNARSIISQDTVQLPAPGTGVAYDEVNRLVYVSMANDSVAMVDPVGVKYLGEIAVDKSPQGMAINPLTRKLYVASMSGPSVSVIDLTINKMVKAEFVQSSQPQRVAVDPIKNRIYVAGYANFLVDQIDGNTDTNIGYRSVNCRYPNDVAVNPLNRDLLTPCWQDQELWIFRFLTHP